MTHRTIFIGIVCGLALVLVVVSNYAAALRDQVLMQRYDAARRVEQCDGTVVVVRGAHGESWACGYAPGQYKRRY